MEDVVEVTYEWDLEHRVLDGTGKDHLNQMADILEGQLVKMIETPYEEKIVVCLQQGINVRIALAEGVLTIPNQANTRATRLNSASKTNTHFRKEPWPDRSLHRRRYSAPR